jgi:hypothetical protein
MLKPIAPELELFVFSLNYIQKNMANCQITRNESQSFRDSFQRISSRKNSEKNFDSSDYL